MYYCCYKYYLTEQNRINECITTTTITVGQDSVFGIGTCYGLDSPGTTCQCRQGCPHLSRLALGLPSFHNRYRVIARMPIFSALWCLAVWDVLIWAHALRQVLFNKHMIKWVNVQLYKLSPALARKLVFYQSVPELHRTVHLSYPWTLVHKVLSCLQLPNKTAVLSPLQSTPGYRCSITFVSCTDTLLFLATCKTTGCKVLWSLLP